MILVTGASGFVGSALLRRLASEGRNVRAVYRDDRVQPLADVQRVRIGDLGPDLDWGVALTSVAVVVHAAARVHVMRETAVDPLEEFRRVNVAGTLSLARQAAAAGVRRFVFISSIKVNGESTMPGHPFTERDAPAPQDAYGVSKSEAEQGLQALARETGMELVIIRPPLVYGPGVRANFRALVHAVARGLPMPLAAVDNRRSLVGLDNLVDFIQICLTHPGAAGQVFLVSDGEDLSTPDLVRRIAHALGRSPRLFPLPMWMLKIAAALLGRRATLDRVCGDLQVDITKARTILGWRPPVPVSEGLTRVVRDLTS